MYTRKCHSAEETMAFGELLSERLLAGDVITLEGDLGAGKTTFTKGLAKGLGISEMVNSPTFTIIKEYLGRLPLYHMDVYRISGQEDLGFEEYLDGDGVTVIEWPSVIKDQLPDTLLKVMIRSTESNSREITLEPIGQRYAQLCKELSEDEYTGH